MAGDTAFEESPHQLAEALARVFVNLDRERKLVMSLDFITAVIREFGPRLFEATAQGHAAPVINSMLQRSKQLSLQMPVGVVGFSPGGKEVLGVEAIGADWLKEVCPPGPKYR